MNHWKLRLEQEKEFLGEHMGRSFFGILEAWVQKLSQNIAAIYKF